MKLDAYSSLTTDIPARHIAVTERGDAASDTSDATLVD